MAELSAHMVEYYEIRLTETGGTTMEQEGYATTMHAMEDLTDGDSLTEAVTKYVERLTQVEDRMSQMEAKFEEKFAMMSMQQPLHPTYYQQPPRLIPSTTAKTSATQPPSHNQYPSTASPPTTAVLPSNIKEEGKTW